MHICGQMTASPVFLFNCLSIVLSFPLVFCFIVYIEIGDSYRINSFGRDKGFQPKQQVDPWHYGVTQRARHHHQVLWILDLRHCDPQSRLLVNDTPMQWYRARHPLRQMNDQRVQPNEVQPPLIHRLI